MVVAAAVQRRTNHAIVSRLRFRDQDVDADRTL